MIRLCGLSFYGFHGVSAAERETGRAYEVDCEFETTYNEAGLTDQVTDTVDYSEVYREIKAVIEGMQFSLLEAIGSRLAVILLDKFPLERVTLKIRKMQPPLPGQVRYVEFEITRYQREQKKTDERSSHTPT